MIEITEASSPEQIAEIRALLIEYSQAIGVDLCFQNFQAELEGLPGAYASPTGRLLLAMVDDEVAGCIALRKLDDETCEMKRLYVRSNFRGHGLGRKLAERILKEARAIGYSRMLLDTLPGVMNSAIALYRTLGFIETAPYYFNPVEGTLYMQLDLT
jgi:ribosomal protein S18 acetylase RimI-like enzyme